MVDRDPTLLAALRGETARWTRSAGLPEVMDAPGPGPGAPVRVGDWTVETVQAALDEGTPALCDGADLIVTTALLDLMQRPFLDTLARAVRARGVPLLATLSVDGRVRWLPGDSDDQAVLSWFQGHQRADRGWGPSPGPDAARVLARALRSFGVSTFLAPADWQVGPGHRAMLEHMIDGFEGAASATSPEPERVRRWAARRRAAIGQLTLVVGHLDLLAVP